MEPKALEQRFERDIKGNELLIYKVCSIYAYTNTDRQDLFQEIVIQLWKAYPKYKGAATFSTWLYRVAINTAITGLRKKRDFIQTYEPNTLPNPVDNNTLNSAQEEQFQQLYTAIEQLNEIEKAIVMLYLENKSYEEMEDILGMNSGNLRVKMSRIKEKLRQLTKSN